MMLTVLGNFALPQSQNNAGRIPVLIGNGPGWLHEATSRRGVVLCGALDYEALCTWRPLYTLADRLAAAGCPTLRFDYPGHGESAAPDPGADFVSQCIATVHAAVDLLKTRCGVEEVVRAVRRRRQEQQHPVHGGSCATTAGGYALPAE